MATDAAIVTITGIDRVVRRLKNFDRKVRAKIERKAIREAGRPVLASAKRLAPIAEEYDVHDVNHSPGTLQRSLRLRALKRTAGRRRAGIYGVQVQTGAEGHLFKGETFYGGFVEFGTVYQQSQRFLQAAAKENEAGSNVIFRRELARYVEEEGAARG